MTKNYIFKSNKILKLNIYLVMCVEPSGYHSDQSLDFYEAVLAYLEQ